MINVSYKGGRWMQNISDSWKKFKLKISDEDFLKSVKVDFFEELLEWLDINGFYAGESPNKHYINSWTVSIYYLNISLFRLEIIDNKMKMLLPIKSENKTSKIQDIPQYDDVLKLIKNKKQICIDSQEAMISIKNLLIKIKNLLLEHVTSEVMLKSLKLVNFRSFENIDIKFENRFTVLVGENGCGKTSILEAISIAISGFLNFFDKDSKYASRNISIDDVRLKSNSYNGEYRFEKQFPILINSDFKFGGDNYEWIRQWKKKNLNRITINKKRISLVANELEREIRNGNNNIILPVFAYYKTGRLWFEEDVKEKQVFDSEKVSRMSAYNNCLKARSNYVEFVNWFKFMKFREFQKKQKIPGFSAVCDAISKSVSSVILENSKSDVKVKIDYDGTDIVIDFNNDRVVPLQYLSDGYKNVIGMISDIAHRMFILNPQLGEEVLIKTSGIVLIDELDLHLHPKWQKHIVNDLKRIFPKVQFIVTTHSPNILATIEQKGIIMLEDFNKVQEVPNTYGRDINSILYEIMGVEERPLDIIKEFEEFYELIDKNKFDEAEEKIEKLAQLLGENDSQIKRAKTILDFERL